MPVPSRADLLDRLKGGYELNRLEVMELLGSFPDGTPIVKTIDGLEGAWRDDFPGASLDATKWTVLHSQGAQAPTLGSNSLLTIPTGTTAGDETELVSSYIFQAPFRVQVGVNTISQRIANQEFSVEIVEVDTTTGLPVSGPDAGTHRAGIFLTGTNAVGGAEIRSVNSGDLINQTGQAYATSTLSAHLWEIDFQGDDCYFYQSAVDSINARTNSWHLNRRLPDPSKWYAVRLRAKNTGAAASNTNFVIDHVYVENSTFIPVEIARSRGASAALESMPVNIQTMPLVNTQSQVRTSGGAAVNRLPALTNTDNNIKGAAGQVYGWHIYNPGASVAYVKLFNKASALVLGTDVPQMTLAVPAGQVISLDSTNGLPFANGIRALASLNAADTDTTVPASALVSSIFYA